MFKLNIFDSSKATAQYIFDRHAPLKGKDLTRSHLKYKLKEGYHDNPAKISTSDQRCFNVVDQR